MMYFVFDPMYPVKTLCRQKTYVLSTALSTIVLSDSSMLLILPCT